MSATRRIRQTGPLLATMILCLTGLTTGAGAQTLIYQNDFESGVFDMAPSGNAPVVTNDIARNGRFAMRSYVNRQTSSNAFRTEATIPGEIKKLSFGEDYWYGFSVLLPGDWEIPNRFEIVAQFHGTPDDGQPQGGPPFSIQTGNGAWKIRNQWADGCRDWILDPIVPDIGRWVDWVIHFRPSPEKEGLLEVWKDGELVARRRGPNTYPDRVGPYFKMGLYLGWRDPDCCGEYRPEKVIYHDELRVAVGADARYEDVYPGAYTGSNLRATSGADHDKGH